MDYVRLTKDPIDLEAIISFLTEPEIGAVATFVGTVRARENDENIQYLEYEAYPEMAVATISQICAEVRERFPSIRKVAISH
ncbi:MAG: molybdenum cofactor biosynthesis protein MoaE, partial [Candidatus Bipolaricaulaceae bacterium]